VSSIFPEKLAPLEEKMLAIARERGRITIADAVTLLAANRTTSSSCICANWFSRGITRPRNKTIRNLQLGKKQCLPLRRRGVA
jgi:hypothetical protein